MSGVINQFGSAGASIYLNRALDTLTSQQTALEAEATSGVVTTSYSGFGSNTATVLALQGQASQIDAWQGNITTAQSTLSVTATTLDSIASIASSLTTTLTELTGTASQSQISLAANSARSELNSLQSLLNTQVGGRSILAGQDATNTVVNADSPLSESALATNIANAVANLSTEGSAAVMSQTIALAADNNPDISPFSSSLSLSGTSASGLSSRIALGQGAMTNVGVVATAGTGATSSSTGSPIRDLMRNLMVVASLGSTDAGSDTVSSLAQGLLQSSSGVVTGLGAMQGQVGLMQDDLSTRATALTQMSTSLTTQYSALTNADLASVATALSQTQTQLQASYSLIADMKGMTLANYI